MTMTMTTATTSSSSSIGIGIGIGIGCPSVSLNAFPTAATTSLRFKYVLKAKAKAKAAAAHTQTTQQQQQQQQQQEEQEQQEQGQYNLNHNKGAGAGAGAGDSDPDLRAVLEIATSSELYELQQILFGPSYLSPLLKSVSVTTNALQFDRFMIDHDFQHRHLFITALESRFLFLAADARSTLRGWRPSYRNILLDVRKLLNIPCSTTLPPEDLELEIFIKIIHASSSSSSRDSDTAPALTLAPAQLCSALLKGGQLLSLLKISHLVSTKLSREMLLKAAKHKFGSEAIKKGLTGATSRYLGLRSLASLFGPMLWGTFLADVVIQMLGTDYIRILQAIYALAQIRILRRHGLHLDKLETGF